MGRGLTVNGDSDDCQVVTTGTTSGSSKALRYLIMTVVEGKLSTTSFRGSSKGATFGEKCQGNAMQLTVSPRTDDNFVIDGEAGLPIEFSTSCRCQRCKQVCRRCCRCSSSRHTVLQVCRPPVYGDTVLAGREGGWRASVRHHRGSRQSHTGQVGDYKSG